MSNEQLMALIQAGTDTKKHTLELWEQNKRIIVRMARRYSGLAEMEDLLQESYIALCAAVDSYEADTNVPFIAYLCIHIHKQFNRYVANSRPVKIPYHMQEKVYQYNNSRRRLTSEIGRTPTRQEIEQDTGFSTEQVMQIEKAVQAGYMASLYSPIHGSEDDSILADIIKDSSNNIEAAEDAIQQEQLKAVIWDVVDTLPADQREVIRARYQRGQTSRETGQEMDMKPQRVAQVEREALRILGQGQQGKILRPYLDEYIYNGGMHGTGVNTFRHTWTSATERVAMQL